MSIKEDEPELYWKSIKGIEFDYFEMGFNKAVDLVGSCFECEYINTDDCPLIDNVSEVDLHTYYCATFDNKDIIY